MSGPEAHLGVGNMNQLRFELDDDVRDEESTGMAVSEQPPQRLEQFGARAVSDTELLAMLIQGNGIGPEKAVAIARQLILEAGSISGLATWTPVEFQAMKGIGRIKALQLGTLVEISRRMMSVQASEKPLLNRADLIAAYMTPLATGLEIEKFWVLCLNRKNRLLKRVELTSGTATAALAHPREVFRAAVRESASAIVCVHNHPSGDPSPSAPDLHVTRVIREAAKAVDIDFIDHVIIGRPSADPLAKGHYSFREAGVL